MPESPITIHVYSELPADLSHPCDLGYHQMAWLVDGSTACGLCGVKP